MISVPASELQRYFSEYEGKAAHEPVEVTHDGGGSSYLVSEQLFKDMMFSYRRAIPVETLTESDGVLIEQTDVLTDRPYSLADIPDINDPSVPAD